MMDSGMARSSGTTAATVNRDALRRDAMALNTSCNWVHTCHHASHHREVHGASHSYLLWHRRRSAPSLTSNADSTGLQHC